MKFKKAGEHFLNVLFVHFSHIRPDDGVMNTQIEGSELPLHFAAKGHNVYSVFHKGNRNYICKIEKGVFVDTSPQEIFSNNFDICIGKSSSFSSYNQQYFKKCDFKINITPLGLPRNKINCDTTFDDGDLIKPPSFELTNYFENNFDAQQKTNTILYVGSIGIDKNQIEFINLIDPSLISEYEVKFFGPIRRAKYKLQMESLLKSKDIHFSISNAISKDDLAQEYLKAKHTALSTEAAPQPYDPSPRVIPESIYSGNSFLIRDTVLIHKDHYKFGHVYKKGDRNSFNENLKKMLNDFSPELSKEMHDFSKECLNMNFACESAYNQIIESHKEHIND